MMEETDTTVAVHQPEKDTHRLYGPVFGDPEKKDLYWMGGVVDCFSSVLSIFGRGDLESSDEDWEVPFESISDMVYLGSGAQGVVFSGNLRGELVAVKKLRDKSELNIKHLRKLNHENIVRFRGICVETPCFGIVMEFCQYGPLFDFLHSGAVFSAKQIVKWARDIALGMNYLHSHKIIHRDLKSPNVLIGDNLVVKVSDFGTCREWNDVSTIMSFTGTVAWMAPEVIRHELCSERVDVWSYGVVLWELLTQEVPYRNLETHAIMWGVGTDTISLPIPSTCPESLRTLLNQCWSRIPKNRPPFKIIAAHLEVAGNDLCSMPVDYTASQVAWRKEVQQGMEKFQTKDDDEPDFAAEIPTQRREELQQARDARQVYEQQLNRANDLYLEVCTVRLQLEQREKAILEREKALKGCRCGFRKNVRLYNQQTSSSSDNIIKPLNLPSFDNAQRRRKKETGVPAQMIVEYQEKNANDPQKIKLTIHSDIRCDCGDECENNNMDTMRQIKDTVVEHNGNVDLAEDAPIVGDLVAQV